MKLLNLGCGNFYHVDWINIDFKSNSNNVRKYDLRKGIPINDKSVDVVYHSHLLEHFSKSDASNFMEDCYRVLKPNGIIRVAVPDLESIINEYLKVFQLAIKGDVDAQNCYEWIILELFDQMVRNVSGGEMLKYMSQENITNEDYIYSRIGYEGKLLREHILANKETSLKNTIIKCKKSFFKKYKNKLKNHLRLLYKKDIEKFNNQQDAQSIGKFRLSGEVHQWMYDRYSLSKLLENVGFSNIKVVDAYTSKINNWSRYHLDVLPDNTIRKPDSLFIEAQK